VESWSRKIRPPPSPLLRRPRAPRPRGRHTTDSPRSDSKGGGSACRRMVGRPFSNCLSRDRSPFYTKGLRETTSQSISSVSDRTPRDSVRNFFGRRDSTGLDHTHQLAKTVTQMGRSRQSTYPTPIREKTSRRMFLRCRRLSIQPSCAYFGVVCPRAIFSP